MTTGIINDMHKWLHQNKAEAIDCVEGCLVDNVVYMCKHGVAFTFEKYLNSCASQHLVRFYRYTEKAAINKEWDLWDALKKAITDPEV